MKKFFALMPKNNKECMVEWSTSNRMYGRMEQQFESEKISSLLFKFLEKRNDTYPINKLFNKFLVNYILTKLGRVGGGIHLKI
jgi:hypothetical protein